MAAKSGIIAQYSLVKLMLATGTFVLLSAAFLWLILVTAAGEYRGRYDGDVVLAFSMVSLPLALWLSSVGFRRWINSGVQRAAILFDEGHFVLNETKRSLFAASDVESVSASEYDPGKIYFRFRDGRKKGVRVSLMKQARADIVVAIERAMVLSAQTDYSSDRVR